jgi:predicted transcriptional regulator
VDIIFSYNTINNLVHFIKRKRMKYRDRMEIINKILQVANGGGATRTKIIYRAYLSHSQMKDYLMDLTQKDLLSYDLDTQTFKTTEKGLRFIEVYNQMDGMIKLPPPSVQPPSQRQSLDVVAVLEE